MEQTAIDLRDQTVFISHGDCLEDAQLVAQLVKDRFGVERVYMNYVGPVIGAHSGPGTLALFYLALSAEPTSISSQRSVSMDEIKWLEVAVNTTPDRLDEVTAKLTAAGMTGWSSRMRGSSSSFWSRTGSTGTMWTRS